MPKALDRNDAAIRIVAFVISACPFFWMLHGYYRDELGINPFENLMKVSGHSAMIFLILSLSITPLRRWLTFTFKRLRVIKWGKRISDWNVLIRMRRMLGLYSFFYCTLHGFVYFEFELDWLYSEILWELRERQFINLGLISWVVLLVLSITSPSYIQKRMRRWWRRVHRLVYPLALLACLHFFLASKPTDQDPYIYAFFVGILLGHRLIVSVLPKFKRSDDNGMLAERR